MRVALLLLIASGSVFADVPLFDPAPASSTGAALRAQARARPSVAPIQSVHSVKLNPGALQANVLTFKVGDTECRVVGKPTKGPHGLTGWAGQNEKCGVFLTSEGNNIAGTIDVFPKSYRLTTHADGWILAELGPLPPPLSASQAEAIRRQPR